MSQKLALIVDDSRSARSVLARMLERHGLEVDTAESAEDAIGYLTRHRPDVIFMDHLMPGMDGLQAVQAIKNDPRTATIPILMYTSQAGDVYLSQARALGAVGVLPKQTRIADVSKALEQLRLIEEGAVPADTRALSPGPLPEPPAAASASSAADAAAAQAPLATLPPQLRTAIEALLSEHAVELRRFVVERLNDNAQRIVGEFRLLMHEAPPPPGGALPVITATPLAAPTGEVAPPPPLPAAPAGRLPWLAAAAAVILALGLAVLWWRGEAGQRDLAAQLEAARAAAASAAQTGVATTAPAAPAQVTPGGVVLVEAVPFGEAALSGARVDHLQPLLDRLVAQGFRGSVQVTSYPGHYCLGASGESPALAAEDTPAAKCEQIASPPDSTAPVQHQSVAFANMVAAARRASGGALDVQLLAGGVEEVAQAYPAPSDTLTAGQWNRVAAANNRIEVRIVPDVTAPVPAAAAPDTGPASPGAGPASPAAAPPGAAGADAPAGGGAPAGATGAAPPALTAQ
ncbi:MAG: response regulator [Steroidobacteraceae bacterium]